MQGETFDFDTLVTIKGTYHSGKLVEDNHTVKAGTIGEEVSFEVFEDFEKGLVKSISFSVVNLKDPA